MTITWYGHSCFLLKSEDGSVVFDPYGDGTVPGYGNLNLKADMVICSHEHHDHNNRNAVILSGNKCNLTVDRIETYHDECKGAKRGSNVISIVKAEGLRVVHLGDLGCELEKEQIKELYGADVLMVPIGGFFTIDSIQALKLVDSVKPKITIPMHYRDEKHGYDVISTADDFIKNCSNPVHYGNSIEISKDMEKQTAILTAE